MTISKCSTKAATFILILSVSFSMAKQDTFIQKSLRGAQQRLSTAYPKNDLTHPLPGGDQFINLPLETYAPNSTNAPTFTGVPTSTVYPRKTNTGTNTNAPTSTA
eukprot:CAMPEP_0194307728 /NCGR_PEP_ID=MMETSP0171-20130528/4627_1 /TAXON_ID=218684 /ORGANISM="Corethron pennatum, Strain L29A3" /LENGTH=104 /DNA_ID=CAMNT_0039059947 /DNA_START=178 /DNA_END=489 /DNA_ORIENTATION=-